MIYGQWAYACQGLSRPIDFGVDKIFYVRKRPKLEFDGRCFWNDTNKEQSISYWCATEGEDWERVEKMVDVGDYWVVRDYQIIEERTKEAKESKTIKIDTPAYTWTTTSALGDYLTVSPNSWQNAYVSTGWSMNDYIDELVQERFNALWRQAFNSESIPTTPNGNDIELAVMGAIYKEDWREALDQLVPRYINSWEIWGPPYGVRELRCAGVDGRTHVFNLDMLGVE